MNRYTVRQVARMSGVSIRTLHHYDDIGVLKPASVGENGYRYYGREELLRLQQVLFHRELGIPLAEIARILDRPDFDRLEALKAQRGRLEGEARRVRRLVRTIDRTIAELEGETTVKDGQLYEGFTPEKQAGYEDWIVERYGDGARAQIKAGREKYAQRTPEQMSRHLDEVGAIEADFGRALGEGIPAGDARLDPLVARHHAWVAAAWPEPPTDEAYVGLADVYLAHPDFRARYESIREGLTEYLAAAMRAWAGRRSA